MVVQADVENTLAQLDVDLELPVLQRRAKTEPVARNGACEVTLRQMRALVRQLALGADEDDRALELRVSESGGDGVTGRAAADDYRLGRSSSRRVRSDQNR